MIHFLGWSFQRSVGAQNKINKKISGTQFGYQPNVSKVGILNDLGTHKESASGTFQTWSGANAFINSLYSDVNAQIYPGPDGFHVQFEVEKEAPDPYSEPATEDWNSIETTTYYA